MPGLLDFLQPPPSEQGRLNMFSQQAPQIRQGLLQAAPVAADFTPVVGDAKGLLDAAKDPSALNIGLGLAGLIPGVPAGLGKLKGLSRRKLQTIDIDELDRAAFGFAEGDKTKLTADKINIQHHGDLDNPQHRFEREGMRWVNSVDLSEPVEATIKQDGKIYLEDGHHRWFAAKLRGEPLSVEFTRIKGKPIEKILDTDLHKSLAAKSRLGPENL